MRKIKIIILKMFIKTELNRVMHVRALVTSDIKGGCRSGRGYKTLKKIKEQSTREIKSLKCILALIER